MSRLSQNKVTIFHLSKPCHFLLLLCVDVSYAGGSHRAGLLQIFSQQFVCALLTQSVAIVCGTLISFKVDKCGMLGDFCTYFLYKRSVGKERCLEKLQGWRLTDLKATKNVAILGLYGMKQI